MIYCPIELFLIAEPLQIYSPPVIAEVRFQKNSFSEYPQQIRSSTHPSAALYSRESGYYAVHYKQPGTVAPGAILQLNEGAIAVFPGEPDEPENVLHLTSTAGIVGPIYTLQPGGSFAIPTGLVFIRFAKGVEVDTQHEAIQNAGYEVAQSLSYAPNAAWLRAPSGSLLEALRGISRLESIPHVEAVEPQMLMPSTPR